MAGAFIASVRKSRKKKALLAVLAAAVAASVFIASYSIYYDTGFTVSHAFYGQHYSLVNGSAVQWLEWGNGTGPRSNMVAYNLTSITFMNETHTSSYFEVIGLVGVGNFYPYAAELFFSGWIIGHIAGNLRPSAIRLNVNTMGNNTNNYAVGGTYVQQYYQSGYLLNQTLFYISPFGSFNQYSGPVNVQKTLPAALFPSGPNGTGSLNVFLPLQNEPLFSSSYYNFRTPFNVVSGMNWRTNASLASLNLSIFVDNIYNTVHFSASLLGLSRNVEISITFLIISENIVGNP